MKELSGFQFELRIKISSQIRCKFSYTILNYILTLTMLKNFAFRPNSHIYIKIQPTWRTNSTAWYRGFVYLELPNLHYLSLPQFLYYTNPPCLIAAFNKTCPREHWMLQWQRSPTEGPGRVSDRWITESLTLKATTFTVLHFAITSIYLFNGLSRPMSTFRKAICISSHKDGGEIPPQLG